MAGARRGVTTGDIDELLRPLSARSVIASALLGTTPPRLPGRILVQLANEFEIGSGTARVALSRMTDRGELLNRDGVYELAGDLAKRKARQDLGRVSVEGAAWDGSWDQAIVVEAGRAAGDRHRLRQALTAARLGEVREGVWLRPANLERNPADSMPGDLVEHVMWFRVAPIEADSMATNIAQIFGTKPWATTAHALIGAMELPGSALAERFRLAAAVLQHLTRDPLLPAGLHPPAWPADLLRSVYASYEAELQAELRQFFATTAVS